ncbi:MAG: aminoglycoside phosphotransferase family protein [Pseudonocardia sp.]|nr:aminoglycoside phosphotransferase family protein [Pseudonocardia sp.]
MSLPPDDVWLPVLGRRTRTTPAVTGREPLTGGYSSPGVERVDLDDGRSVVLKSGRPEEIAAMRAIAVVTGVDRPRLVASGRDWLVLDHHPGPPADPAAPVPDEVWTTLARVHAHWRRNRPRGVPVVDPAWWGRLCETVLVALRGGAERSGDAAYSDAAAAVRAWAADPRIAAALNVLPRTLCHGDAHRGNVVCDPSGAVLIDWGNARVAPAGLDVAVLTAPGPSEPADRTPDPVPAAYTDTLAEALGRPDPPQMRAVEREWALVQAYVQYLGFAADHQGPDRVRAMTGVATAALDRLGPGRS